MKVFVTRGLFQEALDLVRSVAEVKVWPGETPPPYEVLKTEARDADALLCLLTDRVDEGVLKEADRLRIVSNMAVGVDNVDVAAATRRSIYVGNTPDVLTETTADLTFALLLAAARRLAEGDRFVRGGKWKTWSPMELLGIDVYGSTLGIVGLGRIGLAVVRRALGFNMHVLYHSRTRKADLGASLGIIQVGPPQELFSKADFISLNPPLTPQTHHLIGKEALAAMKPTSILINTARGPIVDSQALYKALRDGRLAAAALDVTDPEPLPAGHALLTLDNVLVTPHIGSASVVTRKKMAMIAANNIVDALLGRVPTYCVNPEVLREERCQGILWKETL